jgi:hypothetical protein
MSPGCVCVEGRWTTMAPIKLRLCTFSDTINRGSRGLLYQATIHEWVIHNACLSRESCVEGHRIQLPSAAHRPSRLTGKLALQHRRTTLTVVATTFVSTTKLVIYVVCLSSWQTASRRACWWERVKLPLPLNEARAKARFRKKRALSLDGITWWWLQELNKEITICKLCQ